MRTRLALAVLTLLSWACNAEVVGGAPDARPEERRADARPAADAPRATGGDPDAASAADIDAAAGAPADAAPAADGAPPVGMALPQCTGRAFPAHATSEWRHPFVSPIVAAFEPEHAADDALVAVAPGAAVAVTVGAKFEYGAVFKDLEDETIRVYLDDCSGWKYLGQSITDDDGRISFSFGPLPAGIYDLRYEVAGDGTTAPAQLWILPRGTHVTIYDIDGTLTTSDFEVVKDFFSEILTGAYVPEAYPGAAQMTRAHRHEKRVGVYITGRPYWLRKVTREWLGDLAFAPGPLFLARTTGDVVPTDSGVGAFKLDLLKTFDAAGFRLDSAQGNATTDIYAYLGAGIPPEDVWIIGTHGGESGTQAVSGGWTQHAAEIEAAGPVLQPFEW